MDELGSQKERTEKVIFAIRTTQKKLRWKLGKDIKHLETRKAWGHLPPDATLEDYQAIIKAILHDDDASVYLYHYGNDFYPTIVTEINSHPWLVMFSLESILETAFIVEYPEKYLNKHQFECIGTLIEVLE